MQIIEKPWGKEEWLEVGERYVVKRLTMFKGHRCSLQYHNKKTETAYVLSGLLKLYIGDTKESLKEVILKPGEHMTVTAGKVHRMEGIEDSVYLEASTPELDDLVRL